MGINNLLNVFNLKSNVNIVDNFILFQYDFDSKITENFQIFNNESYNEFNDYLTSYGYEWSFIIDECDYLINQASFSLIELDETLDNASIQLMIHKKGNTVIIFDEGVFYKFLQTQTVEQLLKTFSNYNSGLKFINEDTLNSYSTRFLSLNKDELEVYEESNISSTCHFSNIASFKFSPSDFNFVIEKSGDYLIKLLKRLKYTFTLIYIYDYSEINGNQLTLKLNGHKTFNFSIDIMNESLDSMEEYYKIFKWCYNEHNKIEDKIGISRNILSVYLKENSVSIDNNVFFSILSANNTYIKDNISRYIDVRTKVHSQVERITEKITKTVDTFLSNFQKSIFVFISFYLTVFVFRIYTKPNISEILNEQTTNMGIGLLILSFIFLLLTDYLTYLDFERIKTKYYDTKNRALDLLVDEDINQILNNDSEFKAEKKFLLKKVVAYNIAWIITLILLLVVLAYTSSYI